MDTVDMSIFCEMGFRYHPPYGFPLVRPEVSTIARRLGLDTRTVKSRIKRMEDEGFIKHCQILPNLNYLGLRCSAYNLRFSEPVLKKEAIGRLKLLEGVLAIYEYLESLRVLLVYMTESDLKKILTLIVELTGSDPVKIYDMTMPSANLNLSVTDWQMLRSLRYDALKSTKKLAEELSLTVRTVNNRLERLIEAKAFFVVPVVRAEQVKNLILYMLIFFIDEAQRERVIQEITRTFGENSLTQLINPGGAVVFTMFATKLGEPEDNYIRAKAIDGVRNVFMDFLRESHDCSQVIDKLIEQQISIRQRKETLKQIVRL